MNFSIVRINLRNRKKGKYVFVILEFISLKLLYVEKHEVTSNFLVFNLSCEVVKISECIDEGGHGPGLGHTGAMAYRAV